MPDSIKPIKLAPQQKDFLQKWVGKRIVIYWNPHGEGKMDSIGILKKVTKNGVDVTLDTTEGEVPVFIPFSAFNYIEEYRAPRQ